MEWLTEILKANGLSGVVIFGLAYSLRQKDNELRELHAMHIADLKESNKHLTETAKEVHETVEGLRELTGGLSRPRL